MTNNNLQKSYYKNFIPEKSEDRFLQKCTVYIQEYDDNTILILVENKYLGKIYLFKEGHFYHQIKRSKNYPITIIISDKNIIKKLLSKDTFLIDIHISTHIRFRINDKEDLYEFNSKVLNTISYFKNNIKSKEHNKNEWMEIDNNTQIYEFRKYLEFMEKYYGRLQKIPATIKIVKNQGFLLSINNELRFESIGIRMYANKSKRAYISGYSDWMSIQPTSLFLLNKYINDWGKICLRKLTRKPLEIGIFDENYNILGICEPNIHILNVSKAYLLYRAVRDCTLNDATQVTIAKEFTQVNNFYQALMSIRDLRTEHKNEFQDFVLIIADINVKKGIAYKWYADLCKSSLESCQRLRQEIKKNGVIGFMYLSGSRQSLRLAVPVDVKLLCDYKVLAEKVKAVDILLSEGLVDLLLELKCYNAPATISLSDSIMSGSGGGEELLIMNYSSIYLLRSLRGNRWMRK